MKKISIAVFLVLNSIVLSAQQANIVLELFTSQGCSSCPRADQLLKKVAESAHGGEIITLAYHVDYWDRLGWKDPFSKATYSQYQYKYGQKFGGNSIYTPQLVINGDQHIVGSDVKSLTNLLQKLNNKKFTSKIRLFNPVKGSNKISVDYTVESGLDDNLSVVLVLKEKVTSVKRGENRNKVLTDAYIVLDKKTVASLKIKSGTIDFDLDSKYTLNELQIVGYTQDQQLSLTGACKLELF
ncbi:DUF1223 domain-containing protein [Aquimarina agarilytica]|uniref:DUF1223 domain-containing protein n=1 Tax=Aquimarina agarilytica TaxID=1087449 RepID=UPI00028801B1|nr:DUF1223 domain-containing protein [Aquimarina agarilytica]